MDKTNVPETTAMKDFMALIKIGIVNSNLITVFTGMWLAFVMNDVPFLANFDTIAFTLLGSALIIAGSASLNNYIDRDIDPLMERTKARPTVTGKISYSKVLMIGLALVITGSALLFLTTFTAGVIGIIGILSYVVLYSMWSKRRHVSNTVVGSLSGAVPPLIGWAAVDPTLDVLAWMMFLIMFIWQPPHFYALAMKRSEEYGRAGIPMLPTVKGFAVTKRHMLVWTLLLLPLPFFMTDLGAAFVTLATLLNIGWVALALSGFKTKDDLKWAKYMFVYSLQYLTITFVAMVIVTVI
ncbi:protoheme IX farnesyltransferase [Domibacillus antri]|uniref:Protoheme IX farnesyltransferase n=1 Tax=Domibacillus antri TaxID=1714264 RepID=A0A1Q8Q1I3_9BACI|nr:heme o synthase [Domibacillus antri]OLN21175.1 protoheme IX farnesyltransferase [Domibacillus antri]